MTSKLTIEQAKRLRNDFECWQQDYDPKDDKEQYDMFGRGIVAMDMLIAWMYQEPVAYAVSNDFWNQGNHKQHIDGKQCDLFFPDDVSHGEKFEPDDYDYVFPLYRHAQPAPERDQVRIAHAEWSQATFGNVGPVGPLKHLSKEALEAAAEPGDLSEWADMQFLLWDAQRRAGITDEQITQAMIEKLAVNKQREWPEPKDGEPRLHIKAQPAPVVDADDNFYSWFGREWQENYQHNQYTTAAKQMLGVMAESAWKAGRRAAMLQADPVTTANKLPELIEGMEVSIDVSTCDADAGNRYFGTVAELSELDGAKNGYILLVQDAKPNFNQSGNSPAIPDTWIPVSERMPEDEQEVLTINRMGHLFVSFFDKHSGLFFDRLDAPTACCIEHVLVTHWMPLPNPPKEVK